MSVYYVIVSGFLFWHDFDNMSDVLDTIKINTYILTKLIKLWEKLLELT
jgi:hypothetical protein